MQFDQSIVYFFFVCLFCSINAFLDFFALFFGRDKQRFKLVSGITFYCDTIIFVMLLMFPPRMNGALSYFQNPYNGLYGSMQLISIFIKNNLWQAKCGNPIPSGVGRSTLTAMPFPFFVLLDNHEEFQKIGFFYNSGYLCLLFLFCELDHITQM